VQISAHGFVMVFNEPSYKTVHFVFIYLLVVVSLSLTLSYK